MPTGSTRSASTAGQASADRPELYRTTMPRRLARRMKCASSQGTPTSTTNGANRRHRQPAHRARRFRNLVVNSSRTKKRPSRLGLDLLRHTGQVRLTRDSLALTPKGTALPKRPTLPLRMAGGRLWLPAANEVHAPYDDVTLRTSQDSPSLTGFLRKQKSLTLDFRAHACLVKRLCLLLCPLLPHKSATNQRPSIISPYIC